MNTSTRDATIQRSQILRKLQRDLRSDLSRFDGVGGYIAEHLIPWVKAAPARHNPRPGGLKTRVRKAPAD